MKLYSYDHCPYCVRARMIFGFKNIPFTHTILANDDENTPIKLIGKKMLPILIKPDGSAISESLDIVDYIDGLSSENQISRTVRPAIEQWRAKVVAYYNTLVMPRIVQLGLEEFQTQSAIDYFTHKKTDYIGNFAEHLANTEIYLAQINHDLTELEPWITSESALNNHAGMEDILIFPLLRSLTMVKGIIWPPKVLQYTQQMAQQTHIPLFLDRAR